MAAKDINRVNFTARLGADPEMKYTSGGKAITEMRVAVAGAGNTFDDAGWFQVVAWDKLGEICNQYLSKGSRVALEGRLQVQSWEDKNGGGNRSKVVLVLDGMVMLDSKPEGAQEPAQAPQRQRAAAQPAQRPAATRAPARNVPQTVDSDEDLPF